MTVDAMASDLAEFLLALATFNDFIYGREGIKITRENGTWVLEGKIDRPQQWWDDVDKKWVDIDWSDYNERSVPHDRLSGAMLAALNILRQGHGA